MKRTVLLLALLAACVATPACLPFDIFQDVGTDPHPPSIQVLGVGYQPLETEATEEETDGEGTTSSTTTTTEEPVFYTPEGFVIYPKDDLKKTLILKVKYTDVGGDITSFTIRDLESDLNTSITPSAVETDIDGDGDLETLDVSAYFTGTSGTTNLEEIEFSSTLAGKHRIEVWATDSHESRSPKVTFTVTVVL